MSGIRVLLVSSAGQCGIAAHSELLMQSVKAADREVTFAWPPEALNPKWARHFLGHSQDIRVVHLNHHDALHSQWTPEHVQALEAQGIPVVVTYHDTRESLTPGSKLEVLSTLASAIIVHEPVEGLRGPQIYYWRQGIPAPAQDPTQYGGRGTFFLGDAWKDGTGKMHQPNWKAFPQQPVLGTVGWNFPWKNYDRLLTTCAAEGWATVLLCNNATAQDRMRWEAIQPNLLLIDRWLAQGEITNYLAGCDATAFMYECANTGTSGAIRQGIAARKPVIAMEGCRQFRDLRPLVGSGIRWCRGWDEFPEALVSCAERTRDSYIGRLAHEDSWQSLGYKYAQLYSQLVSSIPQTGKL